MYLNVNNPVNYQLQGFGQNGVRTISTDQLYIQGEYYRVLVAEEDSYVAAVSVLGDDLTAEFVYAGTTIYGLFTEVSVSSGSLTAYIAGPTDIEDVWAYINAYGQTNAATIEAADCAKDAIAPLLDKYYAKASLVMVPSLYKTSIVYSERPLTTDGQLAFTRSNDTATRVGPDGYIEKVRTNLALYSEQFDDAYWTKTATVTANTTISPSGYQDADTLTDASNSYLDVRRSFTITASTAYTFSIFVKKTTGTLTNYAGVGFSAGAGVQTGYAIFNTTTGAVNLADVAGGLVLSAKSTSYGDYYRFEMTFTTGQTSLIVLIYPALSQNGTTLSSNAQGSNVFWGAQLETGDIATNYIPTTASAVSVGPVANLPRLNYPINSDGSVGCPSLLLEPQRTNLNIYSEDFTNATWDKIDLVTTNYANVVVSPDGYTNADKLIPNTTSAQYHGFQLGSGRPSLTGGTVYTYSIFAKAQGYDKIRIQNFSVGVRAQFNLTTGTLINQNGTTSTFITPYGNGWYRIGFTYTQSTTQSSYWNVLVVSTDDNSGNAPVAFAGNGTDSIAVWGSTIEAGAYATSYIPTLGAAVTRATDTYQKGGFGNTSTAGTLFCEFEATNINSANGMYLYGMGVGTTDTLGSSYATSANALSIIANGPALQGKNNGYATTLFSLTPTAGATVKVAIRYDGTNVVAFVNGVKQTVYTDSAVGVKNFIRVNNGEQTSHATKQILFFPTSLTDQELQDLTTL